MSEQVKLKWPAAYVVEWKDPKENSFRRWSEPTGNRMNAEDEIQILRRVIPSMQFRLVEIVTHEEVIE